VIPYEVIVPETRYIDDERTTKVDGVAITTAFLNGSMHIGVVVGKRLQWFPNNEVEWGAPRPIDVRTL
jgi:hypothetical protein